MEVKFDYFTDLVDVLIKDESKTLGERFVINKNKLDKVKAVCGWFLELEEEIDFVELNAEFNDLTGFLEIRVTTEFFSITSLDSPLYKLLDNALKFKVSTKEKGETMELYFAFEAVWDYTD